MDSTSDSRINNNVMRHEYRILTDDEKLQMKHIKDLGLNLLQECDKLGDSRELSIGKTNIEQAVMWIVKHITG